MNEPDPTPPAVSDTPRADAEYKEQLRSYEYIPRNDTPRTNANVTDYCEADRASGQFYIHVCEAHSIERDINAAVAALRDFDSMLSNLLGDIAAKRPLNAERMQPNLETVRDKCRTVLAQIGGRA